MSKNIIVIPAYNGWDVEFEQCIHSWKYYCNKWDIELVIANDIKEYDFEPWGNSVWERWFDSNLEILDYDKILFVDADTMIRWDSPNIFEEFKSESVVVVKDAGNTGYFHLNQWVDVNPNIKTPPENYHNNGFLLLTKDNYLKIRKNILPYYEYWASFYKVGPTGPNACEQTPTNILFYELFPEEIHYSNYEWNNMVMAKYDDGSFINDSYIWHFTGSRMGGHKNKKNIIKQIWEYVKHQYN
jgi:lipopolysaccharide biosynthesis glycosyltransferase